MKEPFLNAFRQMYLTQDANMYPGLYLPNGLKPSEAFFSDISRNLIRWASNVDKTIYYETKDYWYRFMFENTDVGKMSGIVWLRRFDIDSGTEMTVFSNKRDMTHLSMKWKFITIGKEVPVE